MTQRLLFPISVIIFLISLNTHTHTHARALSLRLIVSCLLNQNWLPVHQSPSLTLPPLACESVDVLGDKLSNFVCLCLYGLCSEIISIQYKYIIRSLKINDILRLRISVYNCNKHSFKTLLLEDLILAALHMLLRRAFCASPQKRFLQNASTKRSYINTTNMKKAYLSQNESSAQN